MKAKPGHRQIEPPSKLQQTWMGRTRDLHRLENYHDFLRNARATAAFHHPMSSVVEPFPSTTTSSGHGLWERAGPVVVAVAWRWETRIVILIGCGSKNGPSTRGPPDRPMNQSCMAFLSSASSTNVGHQDIVLRMFCPAIAVENSNRTLLTDTRKEAMDRRKCTERESPVEAVRNTDSIPSLLVRIGWRTTRYHFRTSGNNLCPVCPLVECVVQVVLAINGHTLWLACSAGRESLCRTTTTITHSKVLLLLWSTGDRLPCRR